MVGYINVIGAARRRPPQRGRMLLSRRVPVPDDPATWCRTCWCATVSRAKTFWLTVFCALKL